MYQTLPVLPPVASDDIVNIPFLIVDEDGEPLDLTGATELLVKVFAIGTDGRPTGAAVISDNLAGGVDIDDADGGEVSVDWVAADSTSLGGAVYWFEAKLTDAGGNVRTVRPATIRILADLITS